MTRRVPTSERPLTVAHRAGNELSSLEGAALAGVDLVEADVHRSGGRFEVRHLKTMGPVPLLWDKWRLAPGWTPRLSLETLLNALPVGCEIMLDLKSDVEGHQRDLQELVGRVLDDRDYSVCTQRWSLLEPFHELSRVRVVHSIGSARMLRAVIPHLRRHRGDAVSINRSLLSPRTVETLRREAGVIMTWPVNDLTVARQLLSWGVNGIISDRLDVLEHLSKATAAPDLPTEPA